MLIEAVGPVVDEGRYPARGRVGIPVEVSATIVQTGDAVVRAAVRWRRAGRRAWSESPLASGDTEHWTGSWVPDRPGEYEFTVCAWTDPIATWSARSSAWRAAGESIELDALPLLREWRRLALRRRGPDRALLRGLIELGEQGAWDPLLDALRSPPIVALFDRIDRRADLVQFEGVRRLVVDRERAGFASWYEMFPRSFGGTLTEAARYLPTIAGMGFDVVYLPPIHPIGRTGRRGRGNSDAPADDDPGSPWAIGSPEGGHTSVDPALGGLPALDEFLAAARAVGLEVALDLAWQCSPDHPWVREHPGWFAHRADGSIRYAENPPKRYRDIYPFDFFGRDAAGLWRSLADVVRFWARRGVRIFRVDNPHTKPFAFWEWLLRQIHREFPGTIFLAEAFTRPGTMYHLAKIGFDESYTYFTWRNTPDELTQYFTELTAPPVREFFRPMLFTNTPDILPGILVRLGRPAFQARAFLAATLSPLWGIYSGFEDLERDVVPGTEEYADSEKYRVIRRGGAPPPDQIRAFIGRLNTLRREHPALQHPHHLRFFPVEGPGLLAYERWSADGQDRLIAVVNPVPDAVREGMVHLPEDLAPGDSPFSVEDRLTGETWTWRGRRNYVRLDPAERVAHLFRIGSPGPRSPP